MFAAYRNPARAYAGVAVETSVAGARPIDLVVMLYDGAVEGINKALVNMQSGNVAAKGEAIAGFTSGLDTNVRCSTLSA